FEVGSTGWSIGERGADEALYFSNSLGALTTTTRMLIDTSGNVGIGTTVPLAKLQITENVATARNTIILGSPDSTNDYLAYMGFNVYRDQATAAITHASGNGRGSFLIDHIASSAGNSAATLKLYSPTLTDEGSITIANGNVGINTTSPTAKLDIVGPSAAGSPYQSLALQIASSNFPDRTWQFVLDDGGAVGNMMTIMAAGTRIASFRSDGNVGIGTASPFGVLDLQGDGIFRNEQFSEVVIGGLDAAAAQAKRYEIARARIDYNDWNGIGTIEIEIMEDYYGNGLKKKYVVYWGYVNVSGVYLAEATGYSTTGNNFQVTLGTPVLISGDQYYLPIYVDVQSYIQTTAVLRTNWALTTTNPPEISKMYVDTSPTGSNIDDFTTDTLVNLNSVSGFDTAITGGNVGIGTTSPSYPLHVVGNIYGSTGVIAASTLWTGADIRKLTSGINMTFRDSAGNAEMVIRDGGNVGIGTTNPLQQVHISDSDATDYNPASANTWADILIQNGASPDEGHAAGIGFSLVTTGSYDDNAVGGIAMVKAAPGDSYSGDMVFITRPAASVASEKMRIDKDG
ncbi:MAG: hypothetical protein QF535_03435, partial [Anaerolineales bacterium]|nr:hypothetical protein [Anaerolineales bacterium]